MLPDTSEWYSSASYDHADGLTASDLAWEWLRRNDNYDSDFQQLKRLTDTEATTQAAVISQRWGLRFPGRSSGIST